MEDDAAPLRYADKAMALASAEATPRPVVVVFYAGRTQVAKALHAQIVAQYAHDDEYLETEKAQFEAYAAMSHCDYAAAADVLREAEAAFGRVRPFLSLRRGRALFRPGRADEAAAAFQRAIDNRLAIEPSPVGTIATIWLARTKVNLGDAAGARRGYQDALAEWKAADADIPILVQARKEYAALADSR